MQNNFVNFWQENVIPVSSHNVPNKTVCWSGTDTLENFKKNPTPGYTETSITYVCNSYGFREEEYDLTSTSNILCLGCSYTEGIGLRLEDCWPSLLKKQFNNSKVYNFGVGGTSSDTATRILANISNIFKPQAVFILWPDKSRYELYKDTGPVHYGAWSNGRLLHELIINEHVYNNFCKNQLIMELLQYKYNFKLHIIRVDDLYDDPDFMQLRVKSPARDEHWGPRQHQEIARRFMEQYNAG